MNLLIFQWLHSGEKFHNGTASYFSKTMTAVTILQSIYLLGVTKNVTCKKFQLSKWLILNNKTLELLSNHHIPPDNHQNWRLQWASNSEIDDFRLRLWKLSRLSCTKLCKFHFDVVKPSHKIPLLSTVIWNFWSCFEVFFY